ncbi:MAG TPA: riboflavin synthase [Usitatibacter sp.]|nr:riboflavin synthase [Usitatibacter sp.]
MFSGIVAAVGRIASAVPRGDGLRLRVEARDLGLQDVAIGDSIAIQGVCHTVVARDEAAFEVDTSNATLSVTTGLEAGRAVNLEKSLRLSDRLGGHLVSGHVDGVGEVAAFEDLGGSTRLVVKAPAGLARYIARKGSIAVDGVSLTVNDVRGAAFEVNVIPHTREATTLGRLAAGAKVNLEVDLIARYVERMLAPPEVAK